MVKRYINNHNSSSEYQMPHRSTEPSQQLRHIDFSKKKKRIIKKNEVQMYDELSPLGGKLLAFPEHLLLSFSNPELVPSILTIPITKPLSVSLSLSSSKKNKTQKVKKEYEER